MRRFQDDESILEKGIFDLPDPYMLQDMEKAVKRLKQAKEKQETVMIFGDYDVDGVTSTSLLMHFFTKLGIKTSYRLPHRVEDGYGLKTKFVDEAIELGVDLMVTVDCGSRDRAIISDAKEKGLDIIVTDHHHVPDDMPKDAIAFINPNRPDCEYPFKGLCGAGVAFKLICALAKEYMSNKEYKDYIQSCIDITAIGTVADCMTLRGENHIIVREGLKQVKRSRSQGIYTMIEERIGEDLDGDVFGFQIWPRLNAAGRMDTPYIAVNAILNNGSTLLTTLAKIESLNELRKLKTREFYEDAEQKVNPRNNILFYVSPAIPHGIIWIVAGRLTEKYNKPAIALIDEGDKLVASCRAPEYFSIIDMLEKYSEDLLHYGWHKQAAGFSIARDKFAQFRKKVVEDLNTLDLSKNKKEIQVDAVLALDEIGFKLIENIKHFKPFGMGNPSPVFLIENFKNTWVKFLGSGRDHLRFENRYGFKIFAFGMGEYYEELRSQEKIHILCELAEDSWQGQRGIMLRVIDIVL